ncbi:MAG: transposase, partial [Candidatus Adiutrix sp.]|nr:transposase [Candidatus Adiutrix sp.]
KDHRPDLKQVVVGMILDNEGYPLCAEIWPGDTADVSTLLPVAERLKKRFQIGNICIVADLGMVSRETRNKLVEMNWRYLLGAKMRRENEVRDHVLADDKPFLEISGERQKSKDPSPLKVKDVFVEGRRYVVCKNEEEARKDRHDREAIVESLSKALKRGDKSLVGNRGYRRYLKGAKDSFSIDQSRVEEDERYDGKWVLTTNLDLSASEVALKYKQLLMVESIFRATKTLLETRPVYHKCDETIRGHIWCSFLALLLRKELQDSLETARKENEERLQWAEILDDLEMLTESEIEVGDKRYVLRSESKPGAVKAFAACGLRLPPQMRRL